MTVSRHSLIKRSVRHLSPRHIIRHRLTKRAVQRVADKYGLIYFGAVDAKVDDHKLVRGFTTSHTQIDTLYTVGTIQGYDVSFVARNDLIVTRNQHEKRCHWFIVAVDVQPMLPLPHFYIGPQTANDVFEAAYTQLHPISIGNSAVYPDKFTHNFSVYARPGDTIGVERLFPPAVAGAVVSHFGSMSIEVCDNSVYIYSESRYPNQALVDKMVENAVWFAKILSAVSNARATLDNE